MNSRELNCPHCKKRIRVPLKPGKLLRIHCPKCRSMFEIRFQNPLGQLFRWNRHHSLAQNIRSIGAQLAPLPLYTKAIFILLIVSLGYVTYWLGSLLIQFIIGLL